jgi:hypothetical protein
MTDKQTPKIRSNGHIQNSNFRFKSREKRTRGSERCEKERTATNTFKIQILDSNRAKYAREVVSGAAHRDQ